MIEQNPKEWASLFFRLHRSDTLRQLFPWIAVLCLYSVFVAWFELEYLDLAETSNVRNISLIHTLLSFVISFALVFRTNTAYERWWEGRKLWGALVNNSRNLAMKISAMLPPDDPARAFFRKIIPMYADALKKHLRSEETRMELFDDLPSQLRQHIDLEKHLPNQIAGLMFRQANDLLKEKKITGGQLLFLNAELQSFTDICGSCEPIKTRRFPTPTARLSRNSSFSTSPQCHSAMLSIWAILSCYWSGSFFM